MLYPPMVRVCVGIARMLYPPMVRVCVGIARMLYPPMDSVCVGIAGCYTLLWFDGRYAQILVDASCIFQPLSL